MIPEDGQLSPFARYSSGQNSSAAVLTGRAGAPADPSAGRSKLAGRSTRYSERHDPGMTRTKYVNFHCCRTTGPKRRGIEQQGGAECNAQSTG